MTRFATLLVGSAVMFAAACNDNTPADPTVAATVEVTPRLTSARVGTTQQLAAVAKDANGNAMSGETFTWSSSEPTVATVSSTGLVTFVGAGSTAIIANARGTTGFATIVSDANVASVNMSSGTLNIGLGQALTITATPVDAAGRALFRPITWASSAPAVATVSATGLVTSVSAGTTTITATSEGKIGSTLVTIVPPPPVNTVTLSPTSGYMPTTVGVPLAITLRDASNNVLTDARIVAWSSSDNALATVSGTGVVTGAGVGNVTITALSEGKSATATFRVRTGLKSGVPVTFGNTNNDGDGSLFSVANNNPNTDFNYISSFAVYVPAGTTSLKVTLAGGTGDPDLYLYKPGNTNLLADDGHSFNDGPGETVTIANPVAGVWRIAVDPYIAHANTVITVTITP